MALVLGISGALMSKRLIVPSVTHQFIVVACEYRRAWESSYGAVGLAVVVERALINGDARFLGNGKLSPRGIAAWISVTDQTRV
jgi:hypothetical protein